MSINTFQNINNTQKTINQLLSMMKNKKILFNLLLIIVGGITGLQAQTMYVKEISGTQTTYTLSSIRIMTFWKGNAHILKTDSSKGVHALSGLRYLNFSDLTSGITEPSAQLGHSNLTTYPNPVIDVLNIDLTGVTGEGSLSILTLEGRVVQTQSTSGNRIITINLSHLSQGIYLCRYSNALEIRTVKIIKQQIRRTK